MLKRSFVYAVLIVCVFSFLSIHSISYAGTELNTWRSAWQLMYNAKEIVKEERDQYHIIQDDVKALTGEWDDNEQSNISHINISVIAVCGAIVSVASGGSLYPAAYVIAVTVAKQTIASGQHNVKKEKYLTSMAALVPLMDVAAVSERYADLSQGSTRSYTVTVE